MRRFKDPSEKAIYIEETQPLIPGVFVHKLSILCCIFLRGVTHESRAFALYCLLTQAIRSLMALEKQMSACTAACFSFGLIISYTHESRADALHCLLTQAIRSLMACEKQMSAAQPLVFPCAHYIIFTTTSLPGRSIFAALLKTGSGRSV